MARRAGSLLACGFVLSLCSSAAAQPAAPDSAGAARQDSTARPENGRWTVLPIISSSADTRLAVGGLAQFIFRTTPGSRPSSVRLDAYHTQNRQYHVLLAPRLWLAENTYRLGGKLSFKKWPTSFYGIGNDAREEEQESFTEWLLSASAEVQREFLPGLFVGLQYGLRSSRITGADPGSRLARQLVPGSAGGLVSGIGIGMSWDTRDNDFYPSSGQLVQLAAGMHHRLLGSDFRFSSYSLDLRQYLSPFPRHVLALQGVVRVTTGTAPFRVLPGTGEVLRGYASARYIDGSLVALQAEYRVVPVWWRLGAAVFAGIGQVAPRARAFRAGAFRPAAGLGLRFQVDRKEQVNIRWDYGRGQGSAGDYLDMPEAF